MLRGLVYWIAGALAATAHPPWGRVWLVFAGFYVLGRGLNYARTCPRPLWAGFWRGFVFGFGYFVVSVQWIGEAFHVEAERFGALAPFAIAGLAAALALFWGCAGMVAVRFAPAGYGRALVTAGIFAVAEWLRGHMFTGFPWALVGLVWPAGEPISQSASVFGAYGLTALTLLVCFAIPCALSGPRLHRTSRVLIVSVLLFTGLHFWGAARLAQTLPPTDLRVRLVQANIDQKDKWKPERRMAVLADYVALSRSATADVIVWPEAAIPTPLLQDEEALSAVSGMLRPEQVLMAGSYRTEGSRAGARYFNSIVVLKKSKNTLKLTGVYDKVHLVPFGEYLPFERVFARLGLKQMVAVSDDGFTPGHAPSILDVGTPAHARAWPMICYEALFPHRLPVRPDWIVNVSNDAWFGASSGPAQHFTQAQYRAIEQGLPMVRATPTGVTALIGPEGRVIGNKALKFSQKGSIESLLPFARAPTIYSYFGDCIFAVLILILLFPALWSKRHLGA
jgi:apolipoprotein N-acyltransferase